MQRFIQSQQVKFTKGKTGVKHEKFKYRRCLNIKERTAQFDLREKVSDCTLHVLFHRKSEAVLTKLVFNTLPIALYLIY